MSESSDTEPTHEDRPARPRPSPRGSARPRPTPAARLPEPVEAATGAPAGPAPVDQPMVEQPTAERSIVEQPTAEQPIVEQPTADQPNVEQQSSTEATPPTPPVDTAAPATEAEADSSPETAAAPASDLRTEPAKEIRSAPAAETRLAPPEQTPDSADVPAQSSPENPFGAPQVVPTTPPTTSASDAGTGSGTGSALPVAVSPGVLVSAVGALITFLAAFLTWATVEVTSRAGGPIVGGGTRSVSGLEGDRLGKATLVIALAALVLCALLLAPATRSWGWIALLACGALIVLLAVLDLASISDTTDLKQRLAEVPGCGGNVRCEGDRSAGLGVWLTIVGGLVVMFGAALHAKLLDPLLRRIGKLRRPTATSSS